MSMVVVEESTCMVDDLAESILMQVRELENPAQFDFIERVYCSVHFEEFKLLVDSERFDYEAVQCVLQTLTLSSGYYNAFLGKAIDDIFITFQLWDKKSDQLYGTIVYPS